MTLLNQNLQPEEALSLLIEGNKRFASGFRSVESIASTLRFKELAKDGQRPFGIILTCSDARVPAEIVFDQGLGTLFVIRVAGNIVLPSIVASVEFAVASFQTPLVVVMGHTGCGAIRSALDYSVGKVALESESFHSLMHEIGPAVRSFTEPNSQVLEKNLDAIAASNVYHSIDKLFSMSPIISAAVKAKSVAVVGSIYDLHTGVVSFFGD